jgi:hypothetical protein
MPIDFELQQGLSFGLTNCQTYDRGKVSLAEDSFFVLSGAPKRPVKSIK